MAKAPAFQLYSSDFISSTQDMDAATVGVYIRLLCFQWDNRTIPSDHKKIARIAGVSDSEFIHIWADLSCKFVPAPDEPGRLINPRLHTVRLERDEYIKQASVHGKAGADKRYRTPKNNDGVPYSQPNEVPNENPNGVGIALQSPSTITPIHTDVGKEKKGATAQISEQGDGEQELEIPVSLSPTRPNWAPSWAEVKKYFADFGHPQLARRFFDTNESRGWMDGRNAVMHFQGMANNYIQNSKGKGKTSRKKDPEIPERLRKPPDRDAYYSDEDFQYACDKRVKELGKLGIHLTT